MTTTRDMLWLSVSDGRVLQVWEDERRHARRLSRRSTTEAPVTVIRVNRKIWEDAMVLARGDAKRICVHSATNVDVLMT